jgi:hypothetical protein
VGLAAPTRAPLPDFLDAARAAFEVRSSGASEPPGVGLHTLVPRP